MDPEGGHIYIGDVGQSDWEEISVLPNGVGGLNFGWNAVEGPACFTADCDVEAYAPPALSYGRDKGCSIIGGYTYRGTVQPALQGMYLFGDYCSGIMWVAHADEMVAGEASAVQVLDFDGSPVSFGTDEAGELYVVDRGGRILHVVATAAS